MWMWVKLPGAMSKICGGRSGYLEVCQRYAEVGKSYLEVLVCQGYAEVGKVALRHVKDMRKEVKIT